MRPAPTFVLLLLIPMLLVFGCNRSRKTQERWRVGGLYSIRDGKSGFGVVKILVLDPDVVHVRMYKEIFPSRPKSVNPSTLTLGKLGNEQFGIGHLPVSPETFDSWKPVFLLPQSVSDEELEGYELWKKANGGVFF